MSTSSNNDSDAAPAPMEPPKITKTNIPDDPVQQQKKLDKPPKAKLEVIQQQKKLDKPPKAKLEVIPEKKSVISAKIQPSVGTRIGLQYDHHARNLEEADLKYVLPSMLRRKQKKTLQKNKFDFCKYGVIDLPQPNPNKKVDKDLAVPSPEISSAKVAPRRATPSASWAYPYPPTEEELELKKPKSGIFINETEQKQAVTDYDSFALLYSKTPRPQPETGRGKKKRGKKRGSGLGDIQEGDEEGKSEKKRRKKKRKKKGQEEEAEAEDKPLSMRDVFLAMAEQELMMGMGEGEGEGIESYLTKQFRRKVSKISAGTSYQSKDIRSLRSQEILEEPALSKYIQKFRRESEIKRYQPKKRKFKRGTLESHSFTKVRQPILKDFFFGSKEGSMHQGDENFDEKIRNKQGLCMSVAAYCYSVLKHPNMWTSENIDEILEVGNRLCLGSIDKLHLHEFINELKPDELLKYCVLGDKKIRFLVDEPEITGFILSNDKTVFNLSKGMKLFFARQKAGILKTHDISLAIWKDKYYYMYDARPRTKDLYPASNGTAIMANFYDIPSIISVLLDRSNFENWPFVIYTLKAFKVMNKDDPEVDSAVDLDVKSNYNIMDENKAVVQASFELADKCFDFSRNKQALTMATVCLVYSRITPPSAWHKTTLDKIMIIGNQLFLEIMECESIVDVRVENLPAFFTIGPYIVEIYIYMNMLGDLMYKKCCCQLKGHLETFFETSTNAILQIGTKYYLGVWKQRNMYYCFDPYSRNGEGLKCRDGTGCVSMHSNLPSLVSTIAINFDNNEYVFYLHGLKVCKIHRDPVQSARFPKHLTMDDFPVEDFIKYKMKKSRKPATEKPVTVDYSALAMRRLLAGESPTTSIFEIGSTVESLGMDQIPPMIHRFPSKSILKAHPKKTDVIADLDSPSLSDTQIEPTLPAQPKDDEVEFMDLDSFVLTQEEIELQEIEYDMGEGEDYYGGAGDYEDMGEQEGEEEDEDWYWAMNEYAQVGEFSLPKDVSRISEQINTDITYFPINRDVLYPTYMRGKQQMKRRLAFGKDKDEKGWDVFFPTEPTKTKSQELALDTNFISLPDDTQIIRGSKNVAEFGTDIEFIAPFICIMAAVVSKKYALLSWNGDIVDYILKCGNELYNASKFRYDQVAKLEIPRITLGKNNFKVLVEYIFDTYTRQNILELAIEKILFVRSDMGVLVTPSYACALFYKNHLYYMYDGFGNNEVGLSEGPSNTGAACFARFKDVHALATRIMYNKTKRESNEMVVYTRFVLSSVKVKTLHLSQEDVKKKKKKKKSKDKEEDEVAKEEAELEKMAGEDEAGTGGAPPKSAVGEDEEVDKRKTATNLVGYQYKDGIYVIEGTKSLDGREQMSGELKPDHFACLCASLLLMTCPVKKWDTKKVDQVIDHGRHVYSHADDLDVSEKRTIKNVLIQKHFFDIIVKRLKIENWRDNKTVNIAIDTLLRKRLTYFLVQFPNACYVVHKSQDEFFHLFDPYGFPYKGKQNNACWVRCQDLKMLKWRLKNLKVEGGESYGFYNFEVTSIRKAPKDVILSHKLQLYELEALEIKERLGKPFYEDVDWLKTDILPWSRRANKAATGEERGKVDNMWHNWDVEYPKDLFSLSGNIHQGSERFSPTSRGKQTLANLVVAIGMMEIYELPEWNSAVVDSVIVNGDNYFMECIQDISDADYELSIDDMKEECSIFPFKFKVLFTPVVEGTMFLVRITQFNLYKALRYFFNNYESRCGIICAARTGRKRLVSFGKLRESEYFVFDCDSYGSPMFVDNSGAAYILRMTTLNRLLHVLSLTLRGGDFYIYEVEVSDLSPMS